MKRIKCTLRSSTPTAKVKRCTDERNWCKEMNTVSHTYNVKSKLRIIFLWSNFKMVFEKSTHAATMFHVGDSILKIVSPQLLTTLVSLRNIFACVELKRNCITQINCKTKKKHLSKISVTNRVCMYSMLLETHENESHSVVSWMILDFKKLRGWK